MARRLLGAALILFGGWLLWLPAYPAWLYIDRGGPIADTLIDPVFLIPILRGVLALLGGLLALNASRFGAWSVGAAALLSAVYGGLLLAIGGGAVPYVPHLVYAAILAGSVAALAYLPRRA